MPSPPLRGEAFVRWLEGLKGKESWTPARAALRRSLAFPPGAYPPAFPFLEPVIQMEGWRREAHYLVGGLYAAKDGDHRPGRSLAEAFRELRWARGGRSPDGAVSVEHRFLALLDADSDQLPTRLRSAVTLVEGGIDFAQLLDDLLRWFDPRKRVQIRWARTFYRGTEEPTTQPQENVG